MKDHPLRCYNFQAIFIYLILNLHEILFYVYFTFISSITSYFYPPFAPILKLAGSMVPLYYYFIIISKYL